MKAKQIIIAILVVLGLVLLLNYMQTRQIQADANLTSTINVMPVGIDGEPLDRATVRVTSYDTNKSRLISRPQQGNTYSLMVVPGSYSIQVTSPGHKVSSQLTTIDVDQTQDITMTLEDNK